MGKRRILVVEDKPNESKFIQLQLESLGYEVCGATATGEEAIELAEKEKPDLILTDIILSGELDGIKAAERIQNKLHVPIIYLTAYADEELLQRAKITEPYGYILKPFEQRELHCSVEIALYKHEVEKRLKEQKKLYDITIKSIADAIITTDNNGLITNINPEAQKLTGWNEKKAIGRDLNTVLKIQKEVTDISIPLLQENNYVIIGKDGSKIPIYKSAAPIYDDHGDVFGFVIVFNDISSRKKAEQEEITENKLNSMRYFSNRIAHDFNNQLTVVMGNISLAQLSGDDKAMQNARLREAELACNRVKNLTDELLAFSKTGSVSKIRLSAKDIIEKSANSAVQRSNVSNKFNFHPDLWPVEGDPELLKTAIVQIVKNADQSMPEGGTITINVKNVILNEYVDDEYDPGKYVLISIEDEGIGIPEEHIAKVFDPYFSTKQEGSGFGLSSAYAIIKNHDGYINASSKPGEGTKINIFLPASWLDEETIKNGHHSHTSDLSMSKILIMDDDISVRKVIGEMLSHMGCSVDYASHGSEAIDLYKTSIDNGEGYDALILDLVVSEGMGGFEAARQLLSAYPKAKIIISSGYSNDPVMSSYQRYGFKGMVTKPYNLDILEGVVKKVMELT